MSEIVSYFFIFFIVFYFIFIFVVVLLFFFSLKLPIGVLSLKATEYRHLLFFLNIYCHFDPFEKDNTKCILEAFNFQTRTNVCRTSNLFESLFFKNQYFTMFVFYHRLTLHPESRRYPLTKDQWNQHE